MKRLLNWGFEAVFVMTALIVLKLWVFPFIIYIWYQEVLPIPDWTMIIFGVITCMIYIGLGSTAKYVYRLPLMEAMLGFICIHSLLFLHLTLLIGAFHAWQGLLMDFFSLFLPKETLSPFVLSLVYLGLFLVGRGVYVQEKQEEQKIEKRSFAKLK